MKHAITVILLISCIAPAAAPVVAQENNTTSAPTETATPAPTETPAPTPTAAPEPTSAEAPEESNESVALVLSETLRITEWSYRGGTFIITFESDRYQAVSLTAIPESSSSGENAGSANYRERFVQPNRETVVEIDAPKSGGRARVWIVSDATSETGTIHYLEAGRDSSLLSGPFDGSDVRDGAIGGASGVGFAVLYVVARAKLGADQEGERLA